MNLSQKHGLGEKSAKNTTTVPLGSSETFTGEWEHNLWPSFMISCQTDVDSTLYVDFSNDGGTTSSTFPVGEFLVAANVHEFHIAVKGPRWIRVRLVNGPGSQTYLRLYTYYILPAIPNAPLNQNLGVDSDAITIRPGTDFDLDAARKHITGQRAFFFFGHNDDVGTAYEDIHPNGGDINWLQTATKVEVLSSHAADTSAGLGVRSVELHGLSATGEDQDEVIVMSGTTPVESALTYIRVNKLHNETVGTYGGSHQGNITCRVTGSGSIQSVMVGEEGAVDSSVQYGTGEANNGYWTVPLGKVLYITDVTVNVQASANKTADLILYEREGILDTSAPMDPRRIIWNRFDIVGAHREVFKSHIKIKGLTDLFFRAKASGTGTRIDVKCHFFLVDADIGGA